MVARTGNPLSRQSTTDLAQRVRDELNKPISRSTVWRILDEDAIKPWQYEHWIFPRAANFFEKAAVVLDLYEGYWQGERVDPFDRILACQAIEHEMTIVTPDAALRAYPIRTLW